MAGSSENVSMSGMEEASRESTPGLNETARLTARHEISDTIQSVQEAYGGAEQSLPSDPSHLQCEEGVEELAIVCVENDLPPSRVKLETTRRPLAFEDAMKLPYNQDCLKPLFGPGMSQRAWDSGKFNIELHCTDPWMKKNWRRCRNMCKGGREGGVKFNQLRRNFMRMLWFERKGIHIDWETVDVSSRLVSEQRGTREPINAGTSDGVVDARKHLRGERRRRRRGTSPASKVQLTLGKRGGTDGQQQIITTTVAVDEHEETKPNLLGGIRVLQEAGLTIIKQDDLNRMRSEACHEREEILRLKTELEKEKCLKIAAESNRQDDLTKMHIEGCRDREEIVQLRTELEMEKCQRMAAEASRTEVLQAQISELQQRRDRIPAALSCSLCQQELNVLPTVSLGFCKCQYHVHCFWRHFAANGICMCRKPFPDLLYQYFGQLPQVGTRTGMTEVGHALERMEKDAAVMEDSRANAEMQRAKNVVRELLREWHVAGGRNGWHLLNWSDTMRMRFDAFHADLQKRAQTLGGNMAREAFLSYANKFGLSTGNFTMLYPGLDIPEELVDTHCAGGSNFSDESGTQAKGGINTYASEDGEEGDEYRRKMEMIIRATSDLEARSEIEDSTAGFPKRRRN
ncbi:unnamed protein product [Calypogeia fissa]